MRFRANKRRSHRQFKRNVSRTKAINFRNAMRGGFRL